MRAHCRQSRVHINTEVFKHRMVGRLRLSGIQKQVLALHRAFLRCARSKAEDVRKPLENYINAEFRKDAERIDKKDYNLIEHHLRKGKKQLEILRTSDGFSVARVSRDDVTKP
jgi:succinate dehydrogenase assembly factor 1